MSENNRPLTPEEIVHHLHQLDAEALARLEKLTRSDETLRIAFYEKVRIDGLVERILSLLDENESLLKHCERSECWVFIAAIEAIRGIGKVVNELTKARREAANRRSESACADTVIELHDGPEKLSFGEIRRRLGKVNPGAPLKSVDALKKLYRRRKKKLADREKGIPVFKELLKQINEVYSRLKDRFEEIDWDFEEIDLGDCILHPPKRGQ